MSVNFDKPASLLQPLVDAVREHKRYHIPRPMQINLAAFPKTCDGEHLAQLDSFGMWLRLEYHIDVYGVPKRRVDDGVCHEVTILKAYLSNEKRSFEQEIDTRLLGKQLTDLQTEIGLKLDEEQE